MSAGNNAESCEIIDILCDDTLVHLNNPLWFAAVPLKKRSASQGDLDEPVLYSRWDHIFPKFLRYCLGLTPLALLKNRAK